MSFDKLLCDDILVNCWWPDRIWLALIVKIIIWILICFLWNFSHVISFYQLVLRHFEVYFRVFLRVFVWIILIFINLCSIVLYFLKFYLKFLWLNANIFVKKVRLLNLHNTTISLIWFYLVYCFKSNNLFFSFFFKTSTTIKSLLFESFVMAVF